MGRSRNIKPGFFKNEDLVELDFATRLLFAGLWTVADKAGRLEDRPKKIKMEIFPADDVDVQSMLSHLERAGFVVRYCVDGKDYIQIINWERHQNPHHTEKESEIPAHIGEITVKPPLEPGDSPKQDGGNPADSLIPDSLIPDSLRESAPKPRPSRKCPADFTITPAMQEWAKTECPRVNLVEETKKFMDHTFRDAKVDWLGTWRNWMRKSKDFMPPSPSVTVPASPGIDPAIAKLNADAQKVAPMPADVRQKLAEITRKMTI